MMFMTIVKRSLQKFGRLTVHIGKNVGLSDVRFDNQPALNSDGDINIGVADVEAQTGQNQGDGGSRRAPRVLMLGLRGLPNVQGGVEKHVEQLALQLLKSHWAVDVIGRSPYVNGKDNYIWNGIRVVPFWAPSSPRLEAIVHTFFGVFLAARLRPDILHIHAIGPSMLAPLARLLGLNVVVTHHGFDYNREKWGVVARTALRVGEYFGMNFAHGRIAVSKNIAETMEKQYSVPVKFIPNARLQRASVGQQSAKRRLICTGRFSTKNLLDLIPVSLPNTNRSVEMASSMQQTLVDPSDAIRIRQLTIDDADEVVSLLSVGFPSRTRAYWERAIACLRDRSVPESYPRFGYCLTVAGKLTGVVLLIFSRADDGSIRANVSSWYVDPHYRFYSNMLLAPALRIPDVTFFNISPAPHTLPTIARQGFIPYVEGTFVAAAALGAIRPGARISAISGAAGSDASIAQTHASMGCLSFDVTYAGEHHSFVFLPHVDRRTGIHFVQLVYCSDVASFARFAGSLGRRLLRLGYLFVTIDASGPIRGLVGHYFKGKRVKCARGKTPPRHGDLAETELVLFGP